MKFSFAILASALLFCGSAKAATPKYLLKAELPTKATAHVKVKLEVGGEMIVPTEKDGMKKLPMKVVGNLDYQERFVIWSPDAANVARSIRQYSGAVAKFEVDDKTIERTLSTERRLLLAEVRDGIGVLTGGEGNLTREQLDLANVMANTLAIDHLLPGKEVAEGESWAHEAAVMGPLLCMDHVAVCDVSSIVTEESDRQVQIRLAGTVHGTVDGTPTEMELRAAYLFHLDEKRITRFNLAIKENRKASDIVPGLDVVAKAFVTIDPQDKPLEVSINIEKITSNTGKPLSRTLVYESPAKNFRFEYDNAWYVTAEERDLLSIRYLHDHQLTAHCNLSVLPARSAGRHTSLEQFEQDVRQTLGDKLETVSAATEWDTPRGIHCLGVIADGKVNDVPIQWRHYLVAIDDSPRLSFAVTLERDHAEKFADAERRIIDSVELVPAPPAATATTGSESRR